MNRSSGSISLHPGTCLMLAREIEIAIKWRLIYKCLAPCYQLFWLVECRTICSAACINIYCSSLKLKGEVIHYILVQTSHELFRAIIRVPATVIMNGYPDSKRQDPFQPY